MGTDHEVAHPLHDLADAFHDHDLHRTVLTDEVEGRCRRAARIWAVVALGVFAVAAVFLGVPGDSPYTSWQTIASLAALFVLASGLLLAWRWEGLGGSIALLGGVGLGALAAIEYHPLLALAVAVVFVVPAMLFLFAWQRTRSAAAVLAVAGAVVAFMAAGGAVAYGFYQQGFGAAHPASSLEALPPGVVEWVWSGGVTAHEATVVAKVPDAASVSLRLASVDAESQARTFESQAQSGNEQTQGVYRWTLTGLEPQTEYVYEIGADGVPDDMRRGHFATFSDGPSSFSFAVGSCARVGSNGAVYDTIREMAPDFFLASGDFFYGEVNRNSIEAFTQLYDATLTTPAQSALYRALPIAYTWDDHDFGPNDAAADSPSRPAALAAYTTFVPHYPLAFDTSIGIAQAFTIGRVRFIMTDTRSMRSPKSVADSPEKSMLGSVQRAWLEAELLAAHETHALTVWVNTVPWIAVAEEGADSWAGFASERAALADFIADHGIDRLVMIAGDAHMLAIDDGTNSDYSEGGGAGFPVFHAAALDRPGSAKGGPYSEGAFAGAGQFGLVSVTDAGGDTIGLELRGLDWTGKTVVSLDLEFEVPR